MIFIKSSYDYNYPIILIHTSLSLLSTFILLIYSRSLINQINKINKIERESVAITFDYQYFLHLYQLFYQHI